MQNVAGLCQWWRVSGDKKVSIYKYDAAKHVRMERVDGYRNRQTDGYSQGQELLLEAIWKKLDKV